MNRMVTRSAIMLLMALPAQPAAACDQLASFTAEIRPLLTKYCLDCHGAEEQTAGLRLDVLPFDLQDEQTTDRWIRVYDKLRTGQMPPEGSERPPQDDVTAATQRLHAELHAASLDHQQKHGRVVLRRLNSTEYENIIRDLLGTDVNLKQMLPDDNQAAGFDNVSAFLDVSATHQLLYQEAAEKAIYSTIPPHPPILFRDRRTGREMSERGPNFRQTLTRSCRLDRKSVV